MLKYFQTLPCVIIFALSSFSIFAVDLENVSTSDYWRYMLHFKKDAHKSTVEKDAPFFLAKDGYKNPYSELVKTVDTFMNPSSEGIKQRGHPQCLFPARFHYLKSLGLLSDVEEIRCNGLNEWIAELGFDEIHLVHASQFISNPASVMGHTFIKVVNSRSVNFLNFYIGYAAEMDEDVGMLDYIHKGLMGGFTGVFSQGPFYEKVHEYSQIEKRDIWEYKLKLNQEQRLKFAYLLWESVYNIEQNYFFMDENCSYMSIAILQAIFPDKKLIADLNLYVVPHETIKLLEKNELIESSQGRPSIRKMLRARFKNLSSKQKATVLGIIKTNEIKSLDAETADTVLDYFSLKRHNNMGVLSPDDNRLNQKVLVARSTLSSSEAPIVQLSNPANSHGEYHFEAGQLKLEREYLLLGFRPGIHNFMDKGSGFLENSSFSFLELYIKAQENGVSLHKFNLFNIMNNVPTTAIDPMWSWGSRLSISRDIDSPCFDCQRFELSSVFGKEIYLTNNLYIHLYSALDIYSPKDISRDFILTGFELGVGYIADEKFKLHFKAKSMWDLYRSGQEYFNFNSYLRIYDIVENFDISIEYGQFINHSNEEDNNHYSFLTNLIFSV